MTPRIRNALAALVLTALVLPGSCSRDQDDPAGIQGKAKAKTEQTESLGQVAVIRLAGGDYGYPSPFAHYPRGPGGYKMCLIFDGLLERGDKGLIPWLAERYEVTDQGKTYTFTIRKGVEWHDGNPLTPEDVAFSLEYACRFPMTWSYVFGLIEKVAVLPGHAVQVTLKQPTAAMLDNLGRTRIIPRHIWENVDTPKAFTGKEAVIGTGPYRLTGYSREHGTYRFEAFDRFWGPNPRVGRIEFVPVSQPVLAYEQGDIDLVRVSTDLLPRFQNLPDHRIVKSPAFWGYRLLFNRAEGSSLADPVLRRAFAHAIDLQELVDKIARGAALPGSYGLLSPDHVMAVPVEGYAFSPKKAKKILEGAGYRLRQGSDIRTGPDGTELFFELLCSGREVRMSEILKQRLADVGIGIRIMSTDGKTRDSRVRKNRFTLAIIGHGGWGRDPDFLVTHLAKAFAESDSPSASGGTGEASAELTRLLTRQRLETDPEKRKTLIARIQHLAALEVPEIPLFYTTAYNAYRPAKYDGWMFMFDHHSLEHSKLSYLDWKGQQ